MRTFRTVPVARRAPGQDPLAGCLSVRDSSDFDKSQFPEFAENGPGAVKTAPGSLQGNGLSSIANASILLHQ